MPERTIAAFLIALIFCFPSSVHAQRPAPKLGSIGLPATNQIIPNAAVTWGTWMLQAHVCTTTNNVTECPLTIGNGEEKSLTLCVSNAFLLFSTTDSAAVSLSNQSGAKLNTNADRERERCETVLPHGTTTVMLRPKPAPIKPAAGLAFSLFEAVPGSAPFTARTQVPLLTKMP